MNPYRRFLLIGGIVAVVSGALIAVIANRQAEAADFTAQLTGSLVGGYYDDTAADGAYGFMWFGIGLAVLGVALLVAYVTIKASQPDPAP